MTPESVPWRDVVSDVVTSTLYVSGSRPEMVTLPLASVVVVTDFVVAPVTFIVTDVFATAPLPSSTVTVMEPVATVTVGVAVEFELTTTPDAEPLRLGEPDFVMLTL